jgi:hypothetical protein
VEGTIDNASGVLTDDQRIELANLLATANITSEEHYGTEDMSNMTRITVGSIGFRGRGENRSIGTAFDIKSDVCRFCGGCMYVCPACSLRCTYNEPDNAVCGGCQNIKMPCVEKDNFDDMMCYMDPCVACEIKKD